MVRSIQLVTVFVFAFSAATVQLQAGVMVDITNDGSGGVRFEWVGQVDSLAGLTLDPFPGPSPNQIGSGNGGFFFVGDGSSVRVPSGYSGFSGILNQPSFSFSNFIDGPSFHPGVGTSDGKIFFPDNYVLGTMFSGSASHSSGELTTFLPSRVTWDGGREFFEININQGGVNPSVPEPTTLAIFSFGALGMVGIRRRRPAA